MDGGWLASGQDVGDVTDEVTESATGLVEALLAAAPRVGIALLVAAVFWLMGRAVRWALRRRWSTTRTPSFAKVMSRLGGVLVSFVGVLVAVTITFPSVQPVDVLASLGFFSVAVGFAFQDILENLLAGVLLLLRQPFNGGDQIEVGGHPRGTVEEITIRETRIRTFEGELLIVPNADVYKSALQVQTAYPSKRWSVVVGVSYDDDLDVARTAVIRAIDSVGEVLLEPRPKALLTELAVSTVNIEAQFWTPSRQGDGLQTRDRVIDAIKRELEADEVSMPSDIVELAATRSFAQALRAGDRDG